MSSESSDDLIDLTERADVRLDNIETPTEAYQLQKLQDALAEASTQDEALEIALSAAELSMRALKLAKDPSMKKSLSTRVKSLLEEAERIKFNENWKAKSTGKTRRLPTPRTTVDPTTIRKLQEPFSTRKQSKEEQILVLRASRLNGFKFPPWSTPPNESEFELRDGEQSFSDTPELHLSNAQLSHFDSWKRPHSAIPPPAWLATDEERPPPSMSAPQPIDLVQDAATDCSVVASLCAATSRAERGHAKILRAVVYPYDTDSDKPTISPNGKYIMRLNFNGAFRRVEIDDRLPVSKTARVMHVMDRQNPNLLWPALVEKAYLKVRGGYDFPGSNSGTDLWVLTGWIPEQIFLQSEDTSPKDVWKRILGAHKYGDVLVTMGTGKMSNRSEREIGLAGEHDYAVLDLREVNGQNLLLVKNPWCEGTSWRGLLPLSGIDEEASGSSASLLDDDDQAALPSSHDLLNSKDELSPGTFWIDLNSVTQHFESIYLNWNPGLFKRRQDVHFSWDLSSTIKSACFVNHPQLTVSVDREEPVWLLLCRHFQNRDSDPARGLSTDESERPGFISIYLFDRQGSKVPLSEGAHQRGVFVDSPQTLLRTNKLEPNRVYTVVPAEHDLPRIPHTFTLSAFSNAAITLGYATNKYTHQTTISSAWTEQTAGGNAHSPTYSQNPQFKLTVVYPTPLSILLEAASPSLNVHVKLVHGRGNRIRTVRSRDIVFDSSDYRRQCALATHPVLEAGVYTIVASTFEAGQIGDFTLRIDSDTPAQVTQLPREGAGKITTKLSNAVFREGQQKIAAPMAPQRLAKIATLAKHMPLTASSDSSKTERSMIRVTIELGTGPLRRILIASGDGEYSDSVAGVRTEEVDTSPDMIAHLGMWLVIERMFTPRGLGSEMFAVEVVADALEAVAVGVWRKWDD